MVDHTETIDVKEKDHTTSQQLEWFSQFQWDPAPLPEPLAPKEQDSGKKQQVYSLYWSSFLSPCRFELLCHLRIFPCLSARDLILPSIFGWSGTWLSITRPDIVYTVNILSQFMHQPIQWQLVPGKSMEVGLPSCFWVLFSNVLHRSSSLKEEESSDVKSRAGFSRHRRISWLFGWKILFWLMGALPHTRAHICIFH